MLFAKKAWGKCANSGTEFMFRTWRYFVLPCISDSLNYTYYPSVYRFDPSITFPLIIDNTNNRFSHLSAATQTTWCYTHSNAPKEQLWELCVLYRVHILNFITNFELLLNYVRVNEMNKQWTLGKCLCWTYSYEKCAFVWHFKTVFSFKNT
jgi:hypothetical protein